MKKSDFPRYAIYGLVDPITGEIRYIGKTTTGRKRIREHFRPSDYNRKSHKANWIRTCFNDLKREPGVLKLDSVDETLSVLDADKLLIDLEIKYIKEYKEKGCNLVNGTDGGEGAAGRINSDESKELMSQKTKERYQKMREAGIEIEAPNKNNHVDINGVKGKKCTTCENEKTLDKFINDKNSWDGKSCKCLDCHREQVEDYREKNPHQTLNKEELKQSYEDRKEKMREGVRRAYEENPELREQISKARSKAIIRIDPNTKEEKEYSSALEAKKDGFNNTNLGQAIKHKKLYKGYNWRLKNG